jgi:peptidoglycan/LPS O-acetylase OafA/YrhL
MNKTYLKGLDGLRGIAAIMVIFGHVELLKKSFSLANIYDGGGPFFLYLGTHAVTFFFVLSGFLITYLLIKEKEIGNGISIKNFYLKRVLRIWPVYYLLFICGFFLLPLISRNGLLLPAIIPKPEFWNSFFYNFILLPNFSKVSNPIAFQSWSIGVEEQFYIFWPLLLSRINSLKKLAIVMIAIVIGVYLLRATVYLNDLSIVNWPFLRVINEFFGESRFDNMAIGGLLAIFYYKNPNYKLKVLTKLLIYLAVILFLIKTWSIGFGLDNVLAALTFAGLIYIVINFRNPVLLENSILKYLGKISYGLYMYHVIGIIVSLNLILKFSPTYNGNELNKNILLYFLSIIITITISAISYFFMEERILRFKDRLK